MKLLLRTAPHRTHRTALEVPNRVPRHPFVLESAAQLPAPNYLIDAPIKCMLTCVMHSVWYDGVIIRYAAALREVMAKASPATTVLNRLPHYPGTGPSAPSGGCTDEVWNSTDGRYWVDEEAGQNQFIIP